MNTLNIATVKAFKSTDGLQFITLYIKFKNINTLHQDVFRHIVKQQKAYGVDYYGYLIEKTQ